MIIDAFKMQLWFLTLGVSLESQNSVIMDYNPYGIAVSAGSTKRLNSISKA